MAWDQLQRESAALKDSLRQAPARDRAGLLGRSVECHSLPTIDPERNRIRDSIDFHGRFRRDFHPALSHQAKHLGTGRHRQIPFHTRQHLLVCTRPLAVALQSLCIVPYELLNGRFRDDSLAHSRAFLGR